MTMTSAMTERKPEVGGRPVRVGCVSYLNTRPLIEGVEKLPGLELVVSPPAELIGKLLGNEVDIALISVIDAARHQGEVALLDCGVIGCDGPTHTVRVLLRKEPREVKRIRVDRESHTSVALMRIVLAERYGVSPEVVEIDARTEELADEDDGVLVIGDKAETGAQAGKDWAKELDLGAEWKALTGLPFVYAAWAARKREAGDERIGVARDMLDRQRRHNATRLSWIAAERAQAHGWRPERAREYLRDFMRYELTDEARGAVERLFELAGRHGLAPKGARARWAR